MSQPDVYVISGAGRGIGFKLVEQLSTRLNTIVFAGVRSFPLGPDDQLAVLAAQRPDAVFPMRLTSAVAADNEAAARLIKSKGLKVNVVIANAGSSTGDTPITTVTPSAIRSDIEINTIGPIVLFQAFSSLLSDGAKFIVISSILGQIMESLPYTYNAYGISKAGANFVAKKIDQEVSTVISFPIHPGIVDTDMGKAGAASVGLTTEQLGAITPLASVEGILNVVDVATKATHGGKFWSYTGEELTY